MPVSDALETVARAICESRGKRPDECVFGSGFISQDRNGIVTSGSECSRYAWQDHVGDAQSAIAALSQGAPEPAFIEAMAAEYTRLAWSSAPLSTWPAADRELIIDRFRQSYLAALAATPPSSQGAPEWQPIASAPKDGEPFIVRYLPYGTGNLCMRRVRWVAAGDSIAMEDLGAWLIVFGIDDNWTEALPTSGEPSWSIASDKLNDTAKWLWRPLPAPPEGL